jgi:hypothetical protein
LASLRAAPLDVFILTSGMTISSRRATVLMDDDKPAAPLQECRPQLWFSRKG